MIFSLLPLGTVSIAPDVLVKHFETIFFTPDEPLSLVDPLWAFNFTSSDTTFTDAELVEALSKLNGKAAPGPGMIPSRVIKEVFESNVTRAPLLALMNRCFVSGTVPSSWGESEVFILYKGKGPRDDPNNYRGINLINDFCRVYERLLEGRLARWVLQDNPQGKMQFGFRSGVGTVDAHLLLSTVAKAITRVHGKLCYSCYVDLQKAFPSVYRSKAIESLQLAGAPGNTVRALASSWSMNSCRLRINTYLSRPIMINRGVKEGGINSPTVFSVIYARALGSLGVAELPRNLSDLDLSKVYYFAFADDLALFSANLSRVGVVLRKLEATLPQYGMSVNVAKTVWMPFLPISTRYRVEEPRDFSIRLNREYLSCVDEFKYLGFIINSFLSPKDHIRQKKDSMFVAARSMGRLLRNLQITNVKSIRSYFHSLVASQLYGLECFNFSNEDFYRAAKLFLQSIFCLPDSYPINVVRSLLNLPVFEAMLLNNRINFLQRVLISPAGVQTAKALDYDENSLRAHRVGFSHDLMSFLSTFFDVSHIEDLSWRDLSSLQDLRDQIVIQRNDEFRVSFRASSGLSFWPDISDSATMPLQFGEFLGTLEYEQAQIVLLVLGDVGRFSLSATSSRCPFCPIEFHTFHLFTCPNCPFRSILPTWSSFLSALHSSQWALSITTLFLCLRHWCRGTNFFQSKVEERVNAFFCDL